jgi:hypothetical protein
MMHVKKGMVAFLIVSVALTHSGCMLVALPRLLADRTSRSETPTSYTPSIKLLESTKTIDGKVRLDPFVSRIPTLDEDKRDGQGVISLGSFGSVEGNLTELVHQAILMDFRVNLVFASIRAHEAQPDLVIRGFIYQFDEHHSRPWYARIPLVGNLLSSGDHVEGGVNLDLVVSTPHGRLIGIYQGRSTFPDTGRKEADQKKKRSSFGEHLNRAFTEAVRQIREQMLADQELMSGQWHG